MENDKYKYHDWFCGYKFIKWGLSFFIFGIIIGFGVLIHYLVGSKWNNSETFLTNMTLWFGSPLTLSASYIQLGGLAMTAIGGAKFCVTRLWSVDKRDFNDVHAHKETALMLCNVGLIALFITGYIGYFIIDAIWPSFYYTPIMAGKNLWLILQGLSILVYLIGVLLAFNCIRRCRHCERNGK